MIDAIIDRYIQMRDKKAEMKVEFDGKVAKLDDAMKKCEGVILKHFDSVGVDSVGTKLGTAFKSKVTSVTSADKDAFFKFLSDNDAWYMADIRPAKTAVVEYRDANDDLPPGLNYREETVVRVRRAAA